MIPEPFAFPITLIAARVVSPDPLTIIGNDVLERAVRVQITQPDKPYAVIAVDVACCECILPVYDALPSEEARAAFLHVWRPGAGKLAAGITTLSDAALRSVTAGQIIWPLGFSLSAENDELYAVQSAGAKSLVNREGKLRG